MCKYHQGLGLECEKIHMLNHEKIYADERQNEAVRLSKNKGSTNVVDSKDSHIVESYLEQEVVHIDMKWQ